MARIKCSAAITEPVTDRRIFCIRDDDHGGRHWYESSWDVGKEPQEDVQLSPDPVNHPSHYTAHPSGVECITITRWMNFNIGNAIKYLWRADKKNGLEDLRKARWYIDDEIKRLESLE